MQMLMPMPSYRCRDFQMAFLKKQFLLFVLFLTQGKGKHETLFTNVNRSTNKYSVPYYDIYQLPTIENYFILYFGFHSRPFTNHRTSGKGGGHCFNSLVPLLPLSCLPALRAHVPTCFRAVLFYGFYVSTKKSAKKFSIKNFPIFCAVFNFEDFSIIEKFTFFIIKPFLFISLSCLLHCRKYSDTLFVRDTRVSALWSSYF